MTKPNNQPKRKVTGNIVVIVLLLISAILFVASKYKQTHFHDAQVDEILFYFIHGIGAGQNSSFVTAIVDNLLLCGIIFFLLLLPVIDFYRNRINIKIDLSFLGRKKDILFNPSLMPIRAKVIYAVIVFAISLWVLISSFGVVSYIRYLSDTGNLFEEKYVDPETAKIIFPEKKRNLIYIHLESMENTIASKEAGGKMDQSLIPELEELARDPKNVSFTHKEGSLGGALPIYGTTWTVGSLTAQATGIPLKVDVLGNDRNNYGEKFNSFLPGAYALGDILKKEGYNQSFMMGSKSSFGGRNKLLTEHGDYTIKDYEYAQQNGLIAPDYSVWWGFEDKKLIEFTKDELTRLSSLDKPFNLQLLTVDTHFVDGWLDPSCSTDHQAQYDNVYACSSKMIGELVSWIRQQPFMENTTLIISGDHVGMQTSYYDEMIGENEYERTTYNVFINPAVTPTKGTQSRLFTAFDMYPTTLAALGATIPNDRLAFGANLFSDKQTLLEHYGNVERFNEELRKRSDFYNNEIVAAPSKD